ncbi:uncharacterized protein DUF3168 [Rhodobacter sp. JA431]|uniref:tail completion protein gp17 n=1 Tax=Rhodobacter sp. JA431 TaxID=570013 RepID=UPI000BD186C5|nr:DUF3168 domain-containing protein [Rhodobacter sp. JA431]SOC11448.1 uncharacterized protein DUF3168 [Rhodobacter sp. JA431]
MENDFLALLRGDAALADLVPAGRINWGLSVDGQPLPSIMLTLIGNDNVVTQQGPTNLWQGRVQVDVFGLNYGEARGVAGAVIDLLQCYRGGAFRLIKLDGQRSGLEQASVNLPERITLDFLTSWRAS